MKLLTKRKKVAKKEKQIHYFCCIKDGVHFSLGGKQQSFVNVAQLR
jgi:hypothetical protein